MNHTSTLPAGGFAAPRTVLRLSGADRIRFLNGQVTVNVAKIPSGRAIPACVTTHKGKLDAFVFVREIGGAAADSAAILIDADLDVRESLFARLDRYIIADHCELTDVSDDWHVVHVLESETGAPEIDSVLQLPGAQSFAAERFRGVPGRDVLIPASTELPDELPLASDAEFEFLRVASATPKWGRELTPDVLPPEAGLDQWAVDFAKGCYIGQEVISRIRSVGRVNRSLVAFAVRDAPAAVSLPEDDAPIFDAAGEEAGRLTSLAADPNSSAVRALGFLRRKFLESIDAAAPPPLEADTGPDGSRVSLVPELPARSV